jgi:uncharacterized membrane protein YccC
MINRVATSSAIQIALVSLASYLCGFYFSSLFHRPSAGMGGLWALISGVVVLQSTWRSTLSSAWLRVLGTLMGAIISAAYLSLLPFNPFGMAACIFATVLVCHAAGAPDPARLAALTVALIMVVSSIDSTVSPITNAALRFAESCLGTAVAVLAVEIWPRGDGAVQPGGPGTRDEAPTRS